MTENRNDQTEIIYEKIELPEVSYEGSDRKLLELVSKLKKGTFRIIVFTVVGLILGWFSYTYVTDSFIITKAILAVPYKISEAIYVSVIGTKDAYSAIGEVMMATEYFTHSYLATFLAERITPMLIGGALYGCLGYFTGDKRVFTLQRFLKFVCCHAVIIAAFIALVYGVSAKADYDNNHWKGITYLALETPMESVSLHGNVGEAVKEALESELERDADIQREEENELPFEVWFAHGTRAMRAVVNVEEHYVVTADGSTYHVSEEFCKYVKTYYDTADITEIERMLGEGEGTDERNQD